jgi:hypothetical protein
MTQQEGYSLIGCKGGQLASQGMDQREALEHALPMLHAHWLLNKQGSSMQNASHIPAIGRTRSGCASPTADSRDKQAAHA